MLSFYLSLNSYERILLIIGVIAAVIFLINLTIELFQRYEQGVVTKHGETASILIVMSCLSVFCLLTLYLVKHDFKWYIGYPISFMATMVYLFAVLVIFGRTKKIRAPKMDKRMAIGRQGIVYKPIVPDEAKGCVSVDVFGRTVESFAISADNEPIETGSRIKVIDVDDDVLVCVAINE